MGFVLGHGMGEVAFEIRRFSLLMNKYEHSMTYKSSASNMYSMNR
jgi:hypothetical protein